jgi:hypothetical protein
MSTTTPFLFVNKPPDDAVLWALQRLEITGLQAIRTFDLQTARFEHFDCTCPYHSTEQCNCQMVVILIYKEKRAPVTMVIHGYDQSSWFYLVDTPQQPLESYLQTYIQDVLHLDVDETALL